MNHQGKATVRPQKAGLLGLSLGLAWLAAPGCHHGSASDANFTLVVDDYALVPAGNALQLAISDSAGSLTSVVPDDGSGTFHAHLPSGGSATLVREVPGGSKTTFLLEWVAPPIATIHTSLFGVPTPTATVVPPADATTWSVTLSDVPVTGMVTIRDRCGDASETGFPVNTAGILVPDSSCASADPTTLVAIAFDGSNRALAWGAATGQAPSPGNTVAVDIPLTGALGTVSESIVGFPSCTVATELKTPDGIDLQTDMRNGGGSVSVHTFTGLAGTDSLLTGCSTGTADFSTRQSPIPSTPTIDQSSFPAFGPVSRSISADRATLSWGLETSFGFAGYVVSEWGPPSDTVVFSAIVPPARSSLVVPELPTTVLSPATTDLNYVYVYFVEASGLTYAEAVGDTWNGPAFDGLSNYRSVSGTAYPPF